MDGALVLDKPEGLTSHDVVAAVRRLLPRGTKVGHTGTLDPFATGVLPVLVGKATRLAQFLTTSDKVYRATIAFGCSTTTYDRTGEVVTRASEDAVRALQPSVVREVLATFLGTHLQTPPVYSAKKVAGVRAYERARAGDATPPPPVEVTAHALTLYAFDAARGCAEVDVHCAAGFYVRSLAHDLGVALGVPAHLAALRRTAAGPFVESDAHGLDLVIGEGPAGVTARLRPMGTLLPWMASLQADEDDRLALTHGRAIVKREADLPADVASLPLGGRLRILDAKGTLLAVAVREAPTPGDEGGRFHGDIVLL